MKYEAHFSYPTLTSFRPGWRRLLFYVTHVPVLFAFMVAIMVPLSLVVSGIAGFVYAVKHFAECSQDHIGPCFQSFFTAHRKIFND